MLIVVAGYTFTTAPSYPATDTVETYDLTNLAPTWVTTTSFPLTTIIGSRGVTLNNVFYVTGRRRGNTIIFLSHFKTRVPVHLGMEPSFLNMDRIDAPLCHPEPSWSLCSSRYRPPSPALHRDLLRRDYWIGE